MCKCDGDVICVAMTWTGALGGGMSAVHMLNSVGERMPPCGKPVLN